MLHGVTEVELDEEEDGELFDLEEIDDGEIDNGDIQLTESQNSLSSQIIRSVYDGDDIPDEFDRINNDRNKALLEMDEHVREWTTQRDYLKRSSLDAKGDLVA